MTCRCGSHLWELQRRSKAKSRDPFVAVVVEKDLSDSKDGRLILVGSGGIHVVQGCGRVRGAVGSREIDGYDHVELQAPSEIFHEGRLLEYFEILEHYLARVLLLEVLQGELNRARVSPQGLNVDDALADKLVFPALLPVPTLYSKSERINT